ncbi:MAG: nucleotidyltransferase family protein [Burkholderiales bacterium]|nr:nucleotidyltransferase family protein [Burkholderiales bacterium]
MSGDLLSPLWADPAWRPALGAAGWEALLGQARRARLLPRLALHIEQRGWMADVPAGPRRHLQASLPVAERQRHEVRWEVDRIRRALASVDTPVVLLKGAAYVAAGLPPAPGRLFSDIDILVDRRRLDEVELALRAHGWVQLDRDPYDDRYYRRWMHELPPMRHAVRGTNLDVHHTLTAPTSRFAVDGQRLLADIRPLAGPPGLFVLSPTDMVLHSAVHLFQEGEFDHGLRDLLDMNDLVRHHAAEPGFWPDLVQRAHDLGLQVPLSHALTHLARLFGTRAPEALAPSLRTLDPHPLRRRAMAALLTLALRPNHPSCRHPLAPAARGWLYLRSHWLRMPAPLLVWHLGRKLLRRAGGGPQARAPQTR